MLNPNKSYIRESKTIVLVSEFQLIFHYNNSYIFDIIIEIYDGMVIFDK